MISVIPRFVLKYDFLPIGIVLSAMQKLDKLKDYELINFLIKVSTFFMSVLVGTSFEQQFFLLLLEEHNINPSHRGGPGSSPGQVMWDLWWTKWHWGRFFPSTSVSLVNPHSTNCSTITIYHQGLVQ
jgi:hypothetical protein